MAVGLAIGRSIQPRSHHTRMCGATTILRGRITADFDGRKMRSGRSAQTTRRMFLRRVLQEQPEWVKLLQVISSRMTIYPRSGVIQEAVSRSYVGHWRLTMNETSVAALQYIESTLDDVLAAFETRPHGSPKIRLKRLRSHLPQASQESGEVSWSVEDRDVTYEFPGQTRDEAWRFSRSIYLDRAELTT